MRIAIIEDEYLIADDLVAEIRRSGHEPIGPFAEVSPAFHVASTAAIDAALLDIGLHARASFEFADLLLQRNIPFLIHTGYSREVIPSRFAQYVLEKPVPIRDVVDRLCHHALVHGSSRGGYGVGP
ncbi:response regulator [Bradyrhizobium centrosematis]|uniref:response regulator n=1 Tax=Bradyrhizobium centrosematis TaxID=1300039 RepID=UPI002169D536|nr:response regulator [Bradyrhizobium centrosematis]MCS3758693.1 DNA-binding response OmpR family regulator [Bradyrhizobium centrosematis]MCS3773419.1 DNA-binding response OmpR family regulator [Bradyrhizobium centrosematis]